MMYYSFDSSYQGMHFQSEPLNRCADIHFLPSLQNLAWEKYLESVYMSIYQSYLSHIYLHTLDAIVTARHLLVYTLRRS